MRNVPKEFSFQDRYTVEDLLSIMALLRSPDGCPWDREQNHRSIRLNMIEEAYEAADAIDLDDTAALCEELGDVLLQVVFHSRMAQEAGEFTFDDVCDGICRKLIERHPHVFGEVQVGGADEVLRNWEAIKQKTKQQDTATQTLQAVPRAFPALMRAQKVQKRAAKVGFDWDRLEDAFSKLEEECAEFRQAAKQGDAVHTAEEMGDLLFAAVNVSRFAQVDAEDALHGATEKFIRRFAGVERLACERGMDMKTASLDELDRLWDQVKLEERA